MHVTAESNASRVSSIFNVSGVSIFQCFPCFRSKSNLRRLPAWKELHTDTLQAGGDGYVSSFHWLEEIWSLVLLAYGKLQVFEHRSLHTRRQPFSQLSVELRRLVMQERQEFLPLDPKLVYDIFGEQVFYPLAASTCEGATPNDANHVCVGSAKHGTGRESRCLRVFDDTVEGDHHLGRGVLEHVNWGQIHDLVPRRYVTPIRSPRFRAQKRKSQNPTPRKEIIKSVANPIETSYKLIKM